mmetsp:Transcript_42423/g.79393  ORF Transcript_42423/g.79393 Transcript_42423/m.79393 type:complete len:153 (+) Transcript_42423:42-500(+)
MQLGNTDLVGFYMLRDNSTEVFEQLEGIRLNPSKFICLNDNMDMTANSTTIGEIQSIYDALYPLPSSFELSPDVKGYTNVDDWYRDMWWYQVRRQAWLVTQWVIWCAPFMVVVGWIWWQLVQYGDLHGRSSPPTSPRPTPRARRSRSALLEL